MQFISIVAELERINIDWHEASNTEVKVICPFHDDSTPSLYINTEIKVCDCKSCSWSGTFVQYLGKVEDKTLAEIDGELRERYGVYNQRTIPPQRLIDAHKAIWKETVLLKELLKRGVTADDVKRYDLGTERKRITIPIYDQSRYCINLRKYLPGAPGDKKFRDEKGCGKEVALYPIEQANFDKIVVCGGEIKAICAAKYLNPLGIGAVSATGGEGRWSIELSEMLSGKEKVWLAYDIDEKGESAAALIARQLCPYVKWLGVLHLPMDKEVFPKGGVDDFLVQGGDLEKELDDCPEYEPIKNLEKDYSADPITEVTSLTKMVRSEYLEQRISGECVVSTIDIMPYRIPKQVKVTCPKSVSWCALCPLYAVRQDDMILDIHPENPTILGMIDTNEEGFEDRVRSACQIPSQCKVCNFEFLSYQHAEDVRISEHLDVTKRTEDKSMIPAVFVAEKLQVNTPYTFTGRLYPHPKTNQTTLLASNVVQKSDSLETFDVRKTSHLDLFRPEEWTLQSLTEKLNHIYDDIEANVTRIYSRRLMHILMDLSYHSPLFLTNIFGKPQEKGWVEVLIVGDSSQGKTEAALNLQKHYQLGGWTSCKGSSFAGIVGGVQQMNKKWFITWGAMPLQDRRLLVLEELKGLHQEVFQQLTDVRSSGTAEITKIERQQTYARVRLIALSNPRTERAVATFNTGVAIIKELIGTLEDIRRFDGFYIARKEDVSEEVIGHLIRREHTYTTDYCKELVLWAWCVKNTIFEDQNYLLARSKEFGRKYTDDVPLYDRGGGRYKIARLAAALACRTYSSNEDGTAVVIRKCHVDYICDFLQKIYDSDALGYKSYSEHRELLNNLQDEEKILAEINSFAHPRSMATSILTTENLTNNFMLTAVNCDNQEATRILSMLLRNHAVSKAKKDGMYFKTPAFIKFLKDSLANNEIVDRPEYIDSKIEEEM